MNEIYDTYTIKFPMKKSLEKRDFRDIEWKAKFFM